MDILKELHKSGRTVIITHDDDIARQVNRVIRIMDDGLNLTKYKIRMKNKISGGKRGVEHVF